MAIEEVMTFFIPCLYCGKEVLASSSLSGLGHVKHMENKPGYINEGRFSSRIYYVSPPSFFFNLLFFFCLIFLIHVPLLWNKPIYVGPRRMLPQHGTTTQTEPNEG